MYAISPLLDPLPTLRLWGEEIRSVGFFPNFEIDFPPKAQNRIKAIMGPIVPFPLSANPIGGEGRGEVVLISRDGNEIVFRSGCLRSPLYLTRKIKFKSQSAPIYWAQTL